MGFDLFTSESVAEGHPDKVADRISDAILDALIAQDKKARVAAETLVTTGLVFVAGEITTEGYVDIPNLVHKTVLSVLSWLAFGALLLGRWRRGWRGATAVRWTLSAMGLLMLAFFGTRFVLELVLKRV